MLSKNPILIILAVNKIEEEKDSAHRVRSVAGRPIPITAFELAKVKPK